MRGFPSEHWVTLIGFSLLGEIGVAGAVALGWLPSLDLDGAAKSVWVPLVIAPFVVMMLADRSALPAVLTVFLPLVASAFLVSRSFNAILVNCATISSLAASGIWGRTFLVRARRFIGGSRCELCSYDLRANASERCPECGMMIQEAEGRPSGFPGLWKSVRRPSVAIALFLIVPLTIAIVSLRYAKPYGWQMKNMMANDHLIGMTPTRVNWALGSSFASDVPDGMYVVYMPHVGLFGASVHISIKDGVVNRADLARN